MSLTPLGSCSYVAKLTVTYLIAPLEGDRQRVCPITIKVSPYLYRHYLWSLYQMDMCDKSEGSIWRARLTNGAEIPLKGSHPGGISLNYLRLRLHMQKGLWLYSDVFLSKPGHTPSPWLQIKVTCHMTDINGDKGLHCWCPTPMGRFNFVLKLRPWLVLCS